MIENHLPDIAISCIILILLILLVTLEITRKDTEMPKDQGLIESMAPNTAVVVVNIIAKSGYRGGFTFHNVTPETWNAVLALLDQPAHKPAEMIGNGDTSLNTHPDTEAGKL